MKIHNSLTAKAEEKLKEFDTELNSIKNRASKMQQHCSQLAMLSLVVIPFGLGYVVFKKHRFNKKLFQPKGKNPIQQPLSKSNLISWISPLANETLIMFLGKKLLHFLKKK